MEDIKFYFDRQQPDGTIKKEEIQLEDWIWGVVYKDGSELHQFQNDGKFNQIVSIDQAKVKMWTLYQPKGKGSGRIDIFIPEDKEVALIHKYRHYVFNANTQYEKKYKIYIFGYKIKGQQPHYNFILPNGTIIQTVGEQNPQLSLALK